MLRIKCVHPVAGALAILPKAAGHTVESIIRAASRSRALRSPIGSGGGRLHLPELASGCPPDNGPSKQAG
jgi:hypothetical protein